MKFNELILLQANLGPYGNQDFFGVNEVVIKLKYFSYMNARMAQGIQCKFERRLG